MAESEIRRASQLCKCIESALKSGQWRKATRLGEKVLSSLPHHLWAECLLGQAYLAQGQVGQAQACFRSILERDPECVVAHMGLAFQLERAAGVGEGSEDDSGSRFYFSSFQALQDRQPQQRALIAGYCQRAETLWRLGRLQEAAGEARRVLQMAPQNLKASLLLADMAWQTGDLEEFAEWFHRAQRLDPSGVVARRIWGDEHPLLHILKFDPFFPMEVTGQGEKIQGAADCQFSGSVAEHRAERQEESVSPPDNPPWLLDSCFPSTVTLPELSSWAREVPIQPGEDSSKGLDSQVEADEELAEIELELKRIASSLRVDEVSSFLSSSRPQLTPSPSRSQPVPSSSRPQPIPSPSDSQPVLSSSTSRPLPTPRRSTPGLEVPREFIISNRTALEAKYGESGASRIHRALTELADVTSDEGRVRASVLYLDDPQVLRPYGLTPADPKDPQELRSTLNRLEERFRDENGRGGGGEQTVTYFLLIGGDDIIPFHPLPDLSEDQDELVLSDHPYACSDSSHLYFERAIGRLPDEASEAPDFLLRLIAAATEAHRQQSKRSPHRWSSVWQTLGGWLGRARCDGAMTSFGYTASIWRRAAREVFSSIGQASHLRTSPPLTCEKMPPLGPIAPRFSYFNLHGVRDSAYWYGQRDPTYTADYPLFPVAIEPDNIPVVPHPEAIVFSEACYGAYILNRHQMSSLALRFLAAQALGVVGSTALAYGAIDSPLVGADLLAKAFWEQVKAGYPVGEALRQAKQALIQEMLARQGYLDPEDEKTILSFVLYGDPTLVVETAAGDGVLKTPSGGIDEREGVSVQCMANPRSSSRLNMLSSPNGSESVTSTLCRRRVLKADLVSPEMVARVQHHLASYLPSSMWRDVTVSAQALCSEKQCHEQCSLCQAVAPDQSSGAIPQAQVAKTGGEWLPAEAGLVFTLQQKSPVLGEHAGKVAVHHQIAKVTVDSQGHLVKITISR